MVHRPLQDRTGKRHRPQWLVRRSERVGRCNPTRRLRQRRNRSHRQKPPRCLYGRLIMKGPVTRLLRPTPIEVNPIDHHHAGVSPITPGFRPPALPTKLTFNLIALAASIARTETLRRVSDRTRFFLAIKAFIEAELLVENRNSFTLSKNFLHLADAARASFAGSVGAGIADLVMNRLGYVWRDNAESLCQTYRSRPDFIYGDGPAARHGMVIVEAHGSFAKNITLPTIKKRTTDKLVRQVMPNLTSCHPQYGNVINGYCIGFGSSPNRSGSFCASRTHPLL